jgi:hypothetical protein
VAAVMGWAEKANSFQFTIISAYVAAETFRQNPNHDAETSEDESYE